MDNYTYTVRKVDNLYRVILYRNAIAFFHSRTMPHSVVFNFVTNRRYSLVATIDTKL